MQSFHFVVAILYGFWLGSWLPDYGMGAAWTFAGALGLTFMSMVIEGLFSYLYLCTVFAISAAAILSAAFFGREA